MKQYSIYYYNEGVYNFQKAYSSLKEAKEKYNTIYRGYIKNEEGKILKRYN